MLHTASYTTELAKRRERRSKSSPRFEHGRQSPPERLLLEHGAGHRNGPTQPSTPERISERADAHGAPHGQAVAVGRLDGRPEAPRQHATCARQRLE
eukprot:1214810-Prymnesium_polylepis.1